MESAVNTEEVYTEKFCLKHPQKKTKYFCETDQLNICSRCIVSEHKGHKISDKDDGSLGGASSQQNFVRKSQILIKKIDASTGETAMFEEELNEIAEQLRVSILSFLVDMILINMS